MEVKIVLGYTFGDEGKGVIVQWLCKKAIEEGKRPIDCRLNLVVTHMDVVVDSGVFEYGQKFGKNAIVGAIEPKKVLEAITSHLDIPFDNVYYNDSIESNIKQML